MCDYCLMNCFPARIQAAPGRPQRRQRVDAAHMYVSAPPEGARPGRDAESSTREIAQELSTFRRRQA